MGAMASQITSLAIFHSTVNSGTDQRKHQSSEPLAIVGEFPAQMASNAEKVSIYDVVMFGEILIKTFFFHLGKCLLKISSALHRTFCFGLNVSTLQRSQMSTKTS